MNHDARTYFVGLASNYGIEVNLDSRPSHALAWNRSEQLRIDMNEVFSGLSRLGGVSDVTFRQFTLKFLAAPLFQILLKSRPNQSAAVG